MEQFFRFCVNRINENQFQKSTQTLYDEWQSKRNEKMFRKLDNPSQSKTEERQENSMRPTDRRGRKCALGSDINQ